VRARIVKANAVKEKLDFVLRVVEQWLANGGLGRLDGIEELTWDGLGVRESGKQGVVTVGRYGGDVADA